MRALLCFISISLLVSLSASAQDDFAYDPHSQPPDQTQQTRMILEAGLKALGYDSLASIPLIAAMQEQIPTMATDIIPADTLLRSTAMAGIWAITGGEEPFEGEIRFHPALTADGFKALHYLSARNVRQIYACVVLSRPLPAGYAITVTGNDGVPVDVTPTVRTFDVRDNAGISYPVYEVMADAAPPEGGFHLDVVRR